MSEFSDGAERLLIRARQLNMTSEGAELDATSINPQFASLKEANTAVDELVALGLAVKSSHGAVALTAVGASEVLKRDGV